MPSAIQEVYKSFATTLASVSANNTDLLASMDITAYKSGTLQLTGTWSATVAVQISNDNTNWVNLPIYTAGGSGTAIATTIGANAIYSFVIPNVAYIRIRTTGYTSGTVAGTLYLSISPINAFPIQRVAQVRSDGLDYAYDTTANDTGTSAGMVAGIVAARLFGFDGSNFPRIRVQNIRTDMNAVAIGTIATVWTPTSGKKFRLMGGSISVSAACNVLFEDNTAGNFVWRTPKLLADTPYNFDLGNGKLSAAANNVLKATSSASANITGTLYGTEE